MREQASLRSLCGPPPFRRSCCIRVPDEIVKDPDPATFDAEQVFASGGAPTFNSPDINTINLWPVAPIDAIDAIVRNLSPDASAHRTRVDVSWTPFGIGLQRIPIFSSFVDLAKAGIAGSEQQLSWPTPAAMKAAGRFSVFVDIAHPYDRDLLNNRGQQTVDGLQTSGGRSKTFTFPVRNPSSSPQTISIGKVPSSQAAWATVTPTTLALAGGAQQNVTVKITVPTSVPASPAGTLITATIDVVATAAGRLIGGVSFLILVDS
ncbi:MAG TPA: hypothetical protein VJ775_06195 [Sphingomicrobium sp.]|nr:hypothetical protein [Sphingomicrobium sp.]